LQQVPKKRDAKALSKETPPLDTPMTLAERIALNKRKEAEKQAAIIAEVLKA